MGRKLGWHCDSCKTGEVFHLGYGPHSINPPDFVEESARGEHGALLKLLFGDDPPIKVEVRMRGAHFRCPYCQRLYSGEVAYVQDETGAIFRHTIAPERCPSCESVVDNEGPGVRVRSKGIHRYVSAIWANGCPRCGGDVDRIDLDWR